MSDGEELKRMDLAKFHNLISGRRRGLVAQLLRGSLWFGSFAYATVTWYRNRRYDRNSHLSSAAPIPVISVGNLTTGGTGKTPLVEWVARWLRQRQARVAILSRGYGAEQEGANDEALQLEQLLPDVPHLQDRDRLKTAAIAAEELASQVLLLDDGFQHRRIRRDLDLVLIDCTLPFGYGFQLPRGLLRESKRSLRRAHFIILTRANLVSAATVEELKQSVRAVTASVPIAVCRHQVTGLLSSTGTRRDSDAAGKASTRIAAFCGIGNPDNFRQTLLRHGFELVEFQSFPDHHRYTRGDIESLSQRFSGTSGIEMVVCTHKDLVKIGSERLGTIPLFALTVQVEFQEGFEELEAALTQIVDKIPQEEATSTNGE